MKTTPAFLRCVFIIFSVIFISSSLHANEITPEDSNVFNTLIETINTLLFEYTKRLTPNDNLVYIVVNGHDAQFKQVKELIGYGANPNTCIGPTEETLIKKAVDLGKFKIARALIESGAAFSWISKENITLILES